MPVGVMSDEFAKIAATGLVDGGTSSGSLLELLLSVTDRDARRLLIDNGSINGKFWCASFFNAAFGYVVDQNTINTCWNYMAERYYDPHIRTDIPPKPTGISVTSGIISADTPPDGYTLYIYQWDYVTFSELGTLAEHNDPGTGVYVLATCTDDGGGISLPSGYITI